VKVHIEIDCTPEEARHFMGLPDVSRANDVYVDALTRAMKGMTDPEQMQDFVKHVAPMGQMGLKLFQNFLEGGFSSAGGSAKGPARKD